MPRLSDLKLKAKAKVNVKKRRNQEDKTVKGILDKIPLPKDGQKGERGEKGKDAPSLDEIINKLAPLVKSDSEEISRQMNSITKELYDQIKEENMSENKTLADAVNKIAEALVQSQQEMKTVKTFLSVISSNTDKKGFTFKVSRDARGLIKEVQAEPKGE